MSAKYKKYYRLILLDFGNMQTDTFYLQNKLKNRKDKRQKVLEEKKNVVTGFFCLKV